MPPANPEEEMSKTTVAAAESRAFSAEESAALGAQGRTLESHPNRNTKLGQLEISRALPIRDRRMVGPWCFLDRFGPLSFTGETPMDVPPHPHIGLQTVSWLLEGEMLHTDSLGCEALLLPGGANVMTAGRGISHAERTPARNSGHLNGVQLWVALSEAHRNVEPAFSAIEKVPTVEGRGGIIRVFAGSLGGVESPAPHFSEIVGADVQVRAGATVEIELDPAFEHAVQVLDGQCLLDGQPLDERALHVLGAGRGSVAFSSSEGGRSLLIGGPPFLETILMWWNFVARTPEEIAEARSDWEAQRRFGEVHGHPRPRLAAPDLVRFARPNPLS
jgi:redox-sensitive bicupin YhaK (pirin superfamily)